MATTNTSPVSQIQWPRPDFTKTPADVYVDPKIFAAEQERIFRGPTWQILGTEAEVPNAGDFQTTYIGTTPIVLHRAHDNSLNAYVESLRASRFSGYPRITGQPSLSGVPVPQLAL